MHSAGPRHAMRPPLAIRDSTYRRLELRESGGRVQAGCRNSIKSGHLMWAKKDQNTKEIDARRPFKEYWTSKEHEFTVPGRSSSPSRPRISDREAQR